MVMDNKFKYFREATEKRYRPAVADRGTFAILVYRNNYSLLP
jgi:hypothetical protein